MERSVGRVSLIYLLTSAVVLVVDLWTKKLAEELLAGKEIQILPFLSLVLVYNKGVAFGLFSDSHNLIRLPILLLAPVLALIITFFYSLKRKEPVTGFLMGLIGGGSLGNLYDRLFLGQVRDFLYLHYGWFSWPAFNIADASITCGILLYLLYSSGLHLFTLPKHWGQRSKNT